MEPKVIYRRFRKRLSKHPIGDHIAGLWLSRKFTEHGIIVVSGGRPYPKIINKGGRVVTENCQFYSGVRIEIGEYGNVEIGNGTYINRNTLIISENHVSIGRDCKVSWDVIIMDSDIHPLNSETTQTKPVKIEDNVWIGCRCIILKGVTIGKGAVIAAGSVVTKNIPPHTIYGGSPAKEIGHVLNE